MKMNILSENILKCMSATDRKALKQKTRDETLSAGEVRAEKELQRLIYQELNRRGLFFAWSRTDKRTTATPGNPDFVFPYRGYYVAVEVKMPKGKLSVEQAEVRDKIEREGGIFYIVRSFDEFSRIFCEWIFNK